MTEAEVWAFLAADPPHTGKLATTRLDGRPHVAPIWFALDGEMLVFTTDQESLKGRTLRRDPRVALCVDDEAPPFSFVTVEGVVEIGEDLEELRRWATVIGGRYMGAGRAEAYGARNGVAGELLCRLRPTRIVSAKNVAD
jgi:PPOX class probable F420-dependent enzyme